MSEATITFNVHATMPAASTPIRYGMETLNGGTTLNPTVRRLINEDDYLRSTKANADRLDEAMREVFGD